MCFKKRGRGPRLFALPPLDGSVRPDLDSGSLTHLSQLAQCGDNKPSNSAGENGKSLRLIFLVSAVKHCRLLDAVPLKAGPL